MKLSKSDKILLHMLKKPERRYSVNDFSNPKWYSRAPRIGYKAGSRLSELLKDNKLRSRRINNKPKASEYRLNLIGYTYADFKKHNIQNG